MSYRVEMTALAKADATTAFERIRQIAPYSAERWLGGLFMAILTLADMPARCPLIPEADELGFPARHLIFGRRSAAYRVIFDIQEESPEGARVRVLRIWRGSRAAVTVEDIETEP